MPDVVLARVRQESTKGGLQTATTRPVGSSVQAQGGQTVVSEETKPETTTTATSTRAALTVTSTEPVHIGFHVTLEFDFGGHHPIDPDSASLGPACA